MHRRKKEDEGKKKGEREPSDRTLLRMIDDRSEV